jgi:putative flippase GtrA
MTGMPIFARRLIDLSQLGRFALSGVANTVVGLTVILLLHEWVGLGLIAANVIGYGVGLGLSFSLNRRWTFDHRGPVAGSALRFGAVVLAGFCANLLITKALIGVGLAYAVAQTAGVASYSILTFLGFRHVAFPDHA